MAMKRKKPGGPQPDLIDVESVHEMEWVGLPSYTSEDLTPYHSIKVHLETLGDMNALVAAGVRLPEKDRTAWFPWAERDRYGGRRRISAQPPVLPRYPVFVPSKGRHDSALTVKALTKLGVPYTVVVEPQELDTYRAAMDKIDPTAKLLVTPHQNKGLVETRNFIWDHAEAMGTPYFWTFDDNIRALFRMDANLKTPCADGTILRVIEDFAERYVNLPICGMNYEMFAPRKLIMPPFYMNSRVYSNMLIQTKAADPRGKPYRNEGFFNDDTDLCLRVLKDGNCCVLFNAFLIDKMTTMTVKGGLTGHYQGDGRWKMAEELRAKHPDVTTIVWKWGRWQHQVDYRPFRRNRLKRTPEFEAVASSLPLVNQYGMAIEERTGKGEPWVRAGSGEEATRLAPEASLQPPEKQAAPVVDTTQTELF
jgi:hypothetical protein